MGQECVFSGGEIQERGAVDEAEEQVLIIGIETFKGQVSLSSSELTFQCFPNIIIMYLSTQQLRNYLILSVLTALFVFVSLDDKSLKKELRNSMRTKDNWFE